MTCDMKAEYNNQMAHSWKKSTTGWFWNEHHKRVEILLGAQETYAKGKN